MSKSDVLRFYADLRDNHGWESVESMLLFLPELFGTRELEWFEFSTSHEVLCISRYAYPGRVNEPLLSIQGVSKDQLAFGFYNPRRREKKVRVETDPNTPVVSAWLDEFDRFYNMFLYAHAGRPDRI